MNTLIAIAGIGIVAMIADILRIRKIIFPVAMAGLAIAAFTAVSDWNTNTRYFNDMMFFDNYAAAFSLLIVVIAIIWFVMAVPDLKTGNHYSDKSALVAFSLAGSVVMVSFSNLAMLFLGIEILSVSLYVLAASNKNNLLSNEAGFKYFIMGAFATGIFLFGVALIYGACGTFNLQEINAFVATNKSDLSGQMYTGVLLMIIGLSFKIAAAPFHFWAPDVYEGSPTTITAFMSTIVKVAAFGALYRLMAGCFSQINEWWTTVFIILSVVSMLVGNIMATRQSSFKRLLAFSSISHAGYMLLPLLTLSDLTGTSLLLYGAAYAFASIGIFSLVSVMSENDDESIDSLNGFAKSHPIKAILFSVLLLSLAGIPPLAGFMGKYYAFYAALKSGNTSIVLIAIISSLIGVYYYLQVIIAMYKPTGHTSASFRFTIYQNIVLWTCFLITLILGIFPQLIIGWL